MDEIRLLALKIIRFILIGSLLPVLGLFIIAIYNQRIRRILLWILVPLAVLAVWSYFIFTPIPPGEIETLEEVLAIYQSELLASLPYLIGLALFAAAVLFGGPPAVRALRADQQSSTRQRYLRGLLTWLEPQLANFSTLPEIKPQDLPVHLWVSGPAGVGKSLLLRSLLLAQARQALQDETSPLPVLLDLDQLAPEDDQPTNLESLQPAALPASEALISIATGVQRVSLLVDSSLLTFAPVFVDSPARERRLETLARIIEAFDPVRLVVALPQNVQSPALERLAPDRLPVESLSSVEIRQEIGRLTGDQAPLMMQALEATESGWSGLSSRWLVLEKLARFYLTHQHLPADARELFRETVYKRLAPGNVEDSLSRLAGTLLSEGRPALALEQVSKLVHPLKIRELEQAGLVKEIHGLAQVGFAHPLYLAYFIAVAWLEGQATQPNLADAFNSDPLLSDALIFFNNLLTDTARLEKNIHNLAEQPGSGSKILAAHCLLAAPASRRSPALVEKLAIRLVEEFTGNTEGTRLAWLLMDSLDEAGRLRAWEAALPTLDRAHLKQALHEIARRVPESLRAILWYGEVDICRLVAQAWAEEEPRAAFSLLKEILESGPPGRRQTAIELIGYLPQEASGPYLHELLQSERAPELRLAILRSLARSGIPAIPALLAIIANPDEADEVRACAAEALSSSSLQELQSSGMVRELVRIRHMPTPEPVQRRLAELLEKLGKTSPEGTAAGAIGRWESILNPYRPGQPLTERGVFFGRETMMHTLRAVVENGGRSVLVSERQMGKTTLLHQLRLALDEEFAQGVGVRGIYVNLAGLQPHEFYETLLRETIEQIDDPRLAAETQVPRPYTDTNFERDLEELLVFLEESLGSGMRLALLLDEGDIFLDYPQSFHAALLRIFTSPATERLAVVLAGRELLSGWRQPVPPFYASFPVYPLLPLDRAEALRLATEPVTGTFQYEPAALEILLQATQGRPAEIQAVCHRLVNELLASGERLVTAHQVRTALGQAVLIRVELLEQARRLLEDMLEWVENNPGAPQAELQAHIKQTWDELGRAMVKSVTKTRSGGPRNPAG